MLHRALRRAAVTATVVAGALATAGAAEATFPGTNGKIAFARGFQRCCPSSGNSDIWTVNPGGTALRRLTFTTAREDHPRWSPDGAKIAFSSRRDGNWNVFVMNADGTGVVRVTTNAARDDNPAWSPDGRRLVFVSTRDGDEELFTINSTAPFGTPTQLTRNTSGGDTDPDWSPNGRRIAFGGAVHIDAATGGELRIIETGICCDSGPTWAPGGFTLAFSKFDDIDFTFDIWKVRLDGTGLTNLTDSLDAGSANGDPVFSPSGRQIAFARSDLVAGIAVMGTGGANRHFVTSGEDFNPDWQRIVTP